MGRFDLTLFGGFKVTLDDRLLANFATDKVCALLVYLAMEPHPHPRGQIAGLFWPDTAEQTALTNLRQTAHRLRQSLERANPGAGDQLLVSTRQTLYLNPESLAIDVVNFERLLSLCETHAHATLATCSDCLPRLAEAANLYHGELLAGFGQVDAPPFEEWLLLRREYLQEQALRLFHTLAVAYEMRREDEQTHHWAARQLALDPFRESAHRQLMQSLVRRGQRMAALTQFERCRRLLQTGLGVEPSAETLALYEEIRVSRFPDKVTGRQGDRVTGWQGDRVTDDSSSPPHRSLHNLPVKLAPLIGREQELAELSVRLEQPGLRLLTLVGAGGMGKTRLALALAQTILDFRFRILDSDEPPSTSKSKIENPKFPDGVFFVSLASLANAASLAPTIATTLGLSLQGDDPHQALRQALRYKRLLLILDNFEHLLEGAGLVAELLQAAQGVQIIVTSRERLSVRDEHLYLVPPLAFAPSGSPDADLTTASAQLFVQSARRVQPGFALNPANVAAVLRICRLVQGMPLGLELAAAHVGALPLAAIAAEIERNTGFLSVDWRDIPERQRSMAAVFAWSWQLLGDDERRVLRQVSVFRGGFTPEAGQRVAGANLPVLMSLTHKSLLQLHETAGAGGRYVIHELLRQFAAEQLDASGERTAVEEEHSRFYLDYVAGRGERLGRHEPRQASEEIQSELDNIRQGWEWAALHAQVAELDRAAYSWWQFCLLNGLESEAEQTFDAAAMRVRLFLTQTRADDRLYVQAQRLLGKLLALHADHLFAQGKFTQMADQAREAIALGVTSSGVEGETLGYFVLGRALQDLGQQEEARQAWEKTIRLARSYQALYPGSELLREAEWMANIWLRRILLLFEDYAGGRACVVEALHLCQALGKLRGEMFCRMSLATTDFYMGDQVAARHGYEVALTIARGLGFRWGEASTLRGLGEVSHLEGEHVQAHNFFVDAVTTAHEIGAWYEEALAIAALIRLECQWGDRDAAHQWYTQLEQLMAQVELAPECLAQCLVARAVYAHALGDDQQALAAAEAGWQIAEQFDILNHRAEASIILGHVRASMKQVAAAVAYQQAVDLYRKLGNALLAVEAQAGLAQVALAQGDRAEAQRHVETILPILAGHPRPGFNSPFFIWLTCYHVLTANQDSRAHGLLQTAHVLLQQDAASIQDTALRRLFLEDVATHRALQQAWEEEQGDKVTGWQGDKVNESASHPVTRSPPHPLTPLVGRQQELAEIQTRLQQPDVRLLTLAGAGGMGKTRLALAVAQGILDFGAQNPKFPEGVFFISLASLANASALAPTIATTLGVGLQGADPRQALLQALRYKRLLLILDNFEHLLEGAGLVADLLQAAHGVQILVTSRERLNVRGEHLYLVPPLDFAPSAAHDAGLASASVQLFVQSARRAQPDFQVNPANADAVLRICQLVQGMPLGLELAAACTEMLPVAEIASEIEKSIDFLTVDWSDAPERQQSMRAVFDWSWKLLDEDEQDALRRLAVFRGGFTRQAAERIAGAPLRVLTSLVRKSLLYRTEASGAQRAPASEPGVARYELHELLRQFAAEQLEAAPDMQQYAARHSEFYLAFLADREHRLARNEPRQAAWELRSELDNIRQAWNWASVQAHCALLDQAAYGWWQFCLLAGLASEAEQSIGLAVEHLRRWLAQTPEQDPQYRPGQRLLSKLLALHGNCLFDHSQWERMAVLAQEAITLGQASDGHEGEAFGYFVLGRAWQELERPHEAKAMYEQAIETARRRQSRHASSEMLHEVEWMGYIWLKGMLLLLGDYQAGRECVAQALHICRALGKLRAELSCLTSLATSSFQLGDYTAARQGYEEALPLYRVVDDPAGEAWARCKFGEILRLQGEYVRAQALLESAVTTMRAHGLFYDEAWTLAALVRLHCQLGNRESAGAWRTRLDQLMNERELTQDCRAQGLLAFAVHALLTGDHRQALADAEQGWQLAERFDIPSNRADAAVILGHARNGMEEWAAAATAYQQAAGIYLQIGNTVLVVEPQAGLARSALAQGDRAEAQRQVEKILPILAEHPHAGFNTPFFTWLTCHQVLAANEDPRAGGVLQTAYTLLQQDAASIQDAALRRSFLEEVAMHRALQQAGEEAQGNRAAFTPSPKHVQLE
jgi:predicted ATPase/DNA-binding SARP family transcriptional activator